MNLFSKPDRFSYLAIFLMMLASVLPSYLHAQESEESTEETSEEEIVVEDLTTRGKKGDTTDVIIKVDNLPLDTQSVSFDLSGMRDGGFFQRTGDDDTVTVDGFVFSDESDPEQIVAVSPDDIITTSLSVSIPIEISSFGSARIDVPIQITMNDGTTVVDSGRYTIRSAILNSEPAIFALLAVVVMGIYSLTKVQALEKFFKFFPPLIWMYFIPMILTTICITPDKSALYSPFMSKIMLPAILVLLIIPSDIRTVWKLGPRAIMVMLIATLGITVGAITSFGIFNAFFGDQLPADTWKGIGGLAGSWIGGSPNMTVVFESTETSPNIIGPMIIVDTILAYSWLGILVGLSGYQKQINKFFKADDSIVEELAEKVKIDKEAHDRSPQAFDIALMVGLAFGISQICLYFGPYIYEFIDSIDPLKKIDEKYAIGSVLSGYAWAILIITAISLFLSTTRARKIEYCGASSIGYIGLYLLLTTYGARADLIAILDVPLFFAIGAVWLIIHIVILFIGLWLTKSPIFLGATGSMANIGGTASAPVVAASYYSTMAPVGLLMGILGGVLGTPVALLIAFACKTIAGQ